MKNLCLFAFALLSAVLVVPRVATADTASITTTGFNNNPSYTLPLSGYGEVINNPYFASLPGTYLFTCASGEACFWGQPVLVSGNIPDFDSVAIGGASVSNVYSDDGTLYYANAPFVTVTTHSEPTAPYTSTYTGNAYTLIPGDYLLSTESGAPAGTLDIVDISPTPEPSSLLLLGTGLVAVAGAMRRRYLAA